MAIHTAAQAAAPRWYSVSMLIRLVYGTLFNVGMEYVDRYEHQYLWNSKWLCDFHASHHHQNAQFGEGPADTARSDEYKNRLRTSAL